MLCSVFTTTLLGASLAAHVRDVSLPGDSHPITASATFRSFGNGTEGNYGSLSLEGSASKGLGFFVRGDNGARNSVVVGSQTLEFGGRNAEIGAELRPDNEPWKIRVGFDFPTVPAQDVPSATYDLSYKTKEGWQMEALGYSGGQAALGFRVSNAFKLDNTTSLKVSLAALASGETSVSDSTGNDVRELLYKAAVYMPVRNAVFHAGITNTLGETTRFSLNSSVGHKVGFILGCEVSF